MNAINFIKQHGVDKAREVVEGAAQKLFDNWDCGDMNLFDLLHVLQQSLKGGSDE